MKNRPTLPPRLLKTTQAANYLAVSPWQLRKLIAQGLIPVVQVHNGARFLLDVRDLDGYIERSKVTRDSR
jgi:excisionase family DNA binding protein